MTHNDEPELRTSSPTPDPSPLTPPTSPLAEGTLLWEPSEELKAGATMTRYMAWLERERGLHFDGYQDLWAWSVTDLDAFWGSIWDFFGVLSERPYERVLEQRIMPGTGWFRGPTVNFARQALANASGDRPAIVFQSEIQPLTEISWDTLRQQVASVAAALRAMGIGRGDRVAGYIPNIPQSVVALLACASIGAIWSSCSPDFGTTSVSDRFSQIAPRVLFAVDGYRYNGKDLDRRASVAEIQAALPTLEHTILVPYLDPQASPGDLTSTILWQDLLREPSELTFEPVPFDHPLWILYSSGTTGLPKPIVHGHGGITLELMKVLALHLDLKPEVRFFWFTTTGWMMWNFLIGGLLVGCTILLWDGSPGYPDLDVLWKFAEETGMTYFGTSASYLTACQKAGLEPRKRHDLAKLGGIGSTGSPLPPEGFAWAYRSIKPDIWLGSSSGGTDLCTAFLGPCPLLPVHAGEMQCRCLGAAVQAFDAEGNPVVGEVGELVITEPMPSMPLFFWNDEGNKRYLESYFEMYPGLWRHGDWVKITARGSVIIYGRSDSTINRQGVRMGSSEIYSVVEGVTEVLDSLIIGVELPGDGYSMPLFIVLRPGVTLDDELKRRIKSQVRNRLSPRHVPDDIFAIEQVPRTLNGKKLEVPVKKILMGVPPEKAANRDGMSNPEAIDYFIALAQQPPYRR